MRFLEVDINFSLDYKNSASDALENMMNCTVTNEKSELSMLSQNDFIIHLFCHLYKEATTLPWVKMKRDMTLYKYADIYMLLEKKSDAQISALLDRAKDLNLEKVCAFAILQTSELFEMKAPTTIEKARKALNGDETFLHRVVAPDEKKTYLYRTTDILKRFFMGKRSADLEEMSEQ